MLTEKEHRPGQTTPVPKAPMVEDEVGDAARSSTGAQPLPHGVQWPNRSVLWLLVGLVVVAAVAVTVDRTRHLVDDPRHLVDDPSGAPALMVGSDALIKAKLREPTPVVARSLTRHRARAQRLGRGGR